MHIDINDQIAAQYDIYYVRYFVSPRGLALPGFLQVLRTTTRYVLYAAPSSGHAEYVALADREEVSTATKLFPRNRAFVNGAGRTSRTYIRWDYAAAGDRVASGEVSVWASGTLRYERTQANRLDFIARSPTAAALF